MEQDMSYTSLIGLFGYAVYFHLSPFMYFL